MNNTNKIENILQVHKDLVLDWQIYSKTICKISYEAYINIYLDFETKEFFVKELFKCNCCKRHKLKKPLFYEKWIDYNIPNNDINKDCSCSCRHFSRFLCRSYKLN